MLTSNDSLVVRKGLQKLVLIPRRFLTAQHTGHVRRHRRLTSMHNLQIRAEERGVRRRDPSQASCSEETGCTEERGRDGEGGDVHRDSICCSFCVSVCSVYCVLSSEIFLVSSREDS